MHILCVYLVNEDCNSSLNKSKETNLYSHKRPTFFTLKATERPIDQYSHQGKSAISFALFFSLFLTILPLFACAWCVPASARAQNMSPPSTQWETREMNASRAGLNQDKAAQFSAIETRQSFWPAASDCLHFTYTIYTYIYLQNISSGHCSEICRSCLE